MDSYQEADSCLNVSDTVAERQDLEVVPRMGSSIGINGTNNAVNMLLSDTFIQAYSANYHVRRPDFMLLIKIYPKTRAPRVLLTIFDKSV